MPLDPWNLVSQIPVAAAIIYVVKMMLDREDKKFAHIMRLHEEANQKIVRTQIEIRDAIRELRSDSAV